MKRVALLLCLTPFAFADQITIPNPLSNNSVADAIAVQENFDTLLAESNENDSRITELESAGNRNFVSVNCAEDPAALQAAITNRDDQGPALYFEITGTCEVDYLWTWRSWRIRGVGNDAKIVLSEKGLSDFGFLYIASGYGAHLYLSNLSVRDAGIYAERNGSISLNNVSYEGGQYGVHSTDGGFLWLFGTASRESGAVELTASNGGVINLLVATGSFNVRARTSGIVSCKPSCQDTAISSVDLKGGSTFCAYITKDTTMTIPTIKAGWNSSVLTGRGGSLIVNDEEIDTSSVIDKSGTSC